MANARWNSLNWTNPKDGKRTKIEKLTDIELMDKINVYEGKKYRNKTEGSSPVAYKALLKEMKNRGLRQDIENDCLSS